MRRAWLLALTGLLVVVFAGCGKKDRLVGPEIWPLPAPFPVRSTPQNALLYYKAAWENRDSTRVDSVLADDYMGSSTDHSGTLAFTKSDEVHVVNRLSTDPYLTRVIIQFNAPSTWFRQWYPTDPPEWVALDVPSPRIEVDESIGTSWIADASTVMEFKFRPTAPAPGSPTDTLWQIVRWTESAP